MTEIRQRPDERLDRERRAADFVERLRREEQDPQWLRNFSASIAAMQPEPAAVTAWR